MTLFPGIHAGGLRYHGMAPIVSALVRDGIITPKAVHQMECFEAGVLFAKTEGIIRLRKPPMPFAARLSRQ